MISCPRITIEFPVSLMLKLIRATPTSRFKITCFVRWNVNDALTLDARNNCKQSPSYNTAIVKLIHQLIVKKCLMRQILLIFLFHAP